MLKRPKLPQIHHTRKSIRLHHNLWLGGSSPPLLPFATNKICCPMFSGPTKRMACSELGNSNLGMNTNKLGGVQPTLLKLATRSCGADVQGSGCVLVSRLLTPHKLALFTHQQAHRTHMHARTHAHTHTHTHTHTPRLGRHRRPPTGSHSVCMRARTHTCTHTHMHTHARTHTHASTAPATPPLPTHRQPQRVPVYALADELPLDEAPGKQGGGAGRGQACPEPAGWGAAAGGWAGPRFETGG